MEILDVINSFATKYRELISLLLVFTTVAATCIALWSGAIARNNQRIRVDFYCQWSTVFEPDYEDLEQGAPRYKPDRSCVSASIANIGMRDTRIGWHVFGVRVPFARFAALVNPLTDYRRAAPLPLAAGDSVSLELISPETLDTLIHDSRVQWFPRLRARRLRITFSTPTGEVFRAKIEKSLRREIRNRSRDLPLIFSSKSEEA